MLKTKRIMIMFVAIMLVMVNLSTVKAESNIIDIESYDKLWLQEIQEYETKMGKLIDEISGTDGIYLALAISNVEADREEFVNNVINNYDKLTSEQKVEINGYLIGYADGVNDDSIRRFVSEEKQINNMLKASYYPQDARKYASDYYRNYNLVKYPDLNKIGGDCANFVSQCIYYAGKSMDNKWYITKLNNNNPTPTTISKLNESWDLADPSPWISAKEFGIYWSDKALDTSTYSVSNYLALTDKSISGYATHYVLA